MRAAALTLAAASVAAAALTTAGASCSSPRSDAPVDAGADAACPNDLPAVCPAPPPSYAAEVQPIFARRCYVCHTDGGAAASTHDFATYDRVFAQRSTILNQVYACLMPPADGGTPLGPDERTALLGWLVCHAPNN